MSTTFANHLLGPDTHANRPAASAVPSGTLYSCDDHDLIYQSDGSSWSTWASLGGGGGRVELISEEVLASSATEVVFDSLPTGYQHLMVEVLARSNRSGASTAIRMQLNDDTGTNYSWARTGRHSAGTDVAGEGRNTAYAEAGAMAAADTDAGEAGAYTLTVKNYRNSSFYTYYDSMGNHGNAGATDDVENRYIGGVWLNTAAVTKIRLYPSADDFVTGSMFRLYGVKTLTA